LPIPSTTLDVLTRNLEYLLKLSGGRANDCDDDGDCDGDDIVDICRKCDLCTRCAFAFAPFGTASCPLSCHCNDRLADNELANADIIFCGFEFANFDLDGYEETDELITKKMMRIMMMLVLLRRRRQHLNLEDDGCCIII